MKYRSPSLFEIILFAIGLFGSFFCYQGCHNQLEKDNLIRQISTYKDSAEFYKIKANGNPVEVAFNQSLVIENKKQLQALLAKNDTLTKLISKFKKVAGTTIINQYTTISKDTIRLKDSIPCSFKAFQVKRDSAHYHFIGTIGQDFFSIDSLIIPNTQSIVMGDRKMGFLKGTEKRIEIVNSNPLIRTNKIENYVIQQRKKWYQSTAFKFGIGFLAGSVGYWQLTR